MRSEARINEISIRGITEVRCSDTEKSAMGASSLYSESSKANLLKCLSFAKQPPICTWAQIPNAVTAWGCRLSECINNASVAVHKHRLLLNQVQGRGGRQRPHTTGRLRTVQILKK